MKKLWLLVLALVVINAGVIVALAGGGGGGDDLTSAVRASAEGEGEEEEEEGGLGPAEPDDYFLFQRSTRGDLPRSPTSRARSARRARGARHRRRAAGATPHGRSRDRPTSAGGWSTSRRSERAGHGLRGGRDGRRVEVDRRRRDAAEGVGRRRRAGDRRDRDRCRRRGVGRNRRAQSGRRQHHVRGHRHLRPKTAARTWKRRGLEDSGTTGRIVVNPTDPDTVYVAAGGSLFNPGGERGIYRSTNGGATWRQVLAPETPFTGGADLVMDPSNPTASTPRCGITAASPTCAPTAASAPGCSAPTTAATPGSGSRTCGPSRRATRTGRRTRAGWRATRRSAASASRSRRATRTGCT